MKELLQLENYYDAKYMMFCVIKLKKKSHHT